MRRLRLDSSGTAQTSRRCEEKVVEMQPSTAVGEKGTAWRRLVKPMLGRTRTRMMDERCVVVGLTSEENHRQPFAAFLTQHQFLLILHRVTRETSDAITASVRQRYDAQPMTL